MARIVKTTQKNRKSFLLKAGLSIFLFLQIQMPNAAELIAPEITGFTLNMSTKSVEKCSMLPKKAKEPIAMCCLATLK